VLPAVGAAQGEVMAVVSHDEFIDIYPRGAQTSNQAAV
jgi:hypothetical protein